MNPEWVITGIILLGAMAAGSVSLYVKKKRAEKESSEPEDKAEAP